MCGGTPGARGLGEPAGGLSPRVRGNRTDFALHALGPGSIPACAGEPIGSNQTTAVNKVYPRVCGGTGRLLPKAPLAAGLSPRVRGNLQVTGVIRVSKRSIPACAGEPYRNRNSSRQATVYPRVCGGTIENHAIRLPQRGLSPRVRGNPLPARQNGRYPRSIPACAGEPLTMPGGGQHLKVYPRVCGGTVARRRRHPFDDGLSPRVRGNRRPRRHREQPRRSIPACAGEPGPEPRRSGRRPVYPRVCGGTRRGGRFRRLGQGLSPRVRGNPLYNAESPGRAGSIPACAGEPDGVVVTGFLAGVYPACAGEPP